jgi:hypothetical protein
MKALLCLMSFLPVMALAGVITEDADTFQVTTYNQPLEETEIGKVIEASNSGNIFVTGEYNYDLDGQGFKTFTIITAAVDDSLSKASKTGDEMELFPSPMIIMAYSQAKNLVKVPGQDLNWVNLKIVDPAGNSIGKAPDGNDIQTIFPASYKEHPQDDSVTIHAPLAGEYIIIVMAESDAPPDVAYGIGIRIDGSLQVMLADYLEIPKASEADTLDY